MMSSWRALGIYILVLCDSLRAAGVLEELTGFIFQSESAECGRWLSHHLGALLLMACHCSVELNVNCQYKQITGRASQSVHFLDNDLKGSLEGPGWEASGCSFGFSHGFVILRKPFAAYSALLCFYCCKWGKGGNEKSNGFQLLGGPCGKWMHPFMHYLDALSRLISHVHLISFSFEG